MRSQTTTMMSHRQNHRPSQKYPQHMRTQIAHQKIQHQQCLKLVNLQGTVRKWIMLGRYVRLLHRIFVDHRGCSVSSLLLFTLLSCCSTLYHVRLCSSVHAWTVLDLSDEGFGSPTKFSLELPTHLLLDYILNMHLYKYSALVAEFYDVNFIWLIRKKRSGCLSSKRRSEKKKNGS
jgi:hypothetical protein